MAVAFQSAGTADSGTASSSTINFPGTPSGQMLLAVYGFSGVAAGSGPWISSSTGGGWQRAFYQAPVGGTGVGIEVWNTLDWSISSTDTFNFAASETYVGRGLVYTGQFFDGSTSPVRATSSQAWTGDNPETPTIFALQDETLLAVSADLLNSPGFGTPTPSGSVARIDSNRAGFGTVEITLADYAVASTATIGPFIWTATASSGTTRGAAGVMAIRPASSTTTSDYILTAPLPEDLDLPAGYQVRVRAVSPSTGAAVSGVTITNFSLLVTDLTGGGGSDLAVGPFMLVPGPNA